MFYAQFVLSKKGPLAKIWLAAHWEKKLSKAQVFETNVSEAVDEILKPKVKMALRTTGHLLLGIVRIYSRRANYLLEDCENASLKINLNFSTTGGKSKGAIRDADDTDLPEVLGDFDATLPDNFELPATPVPVNQSRIEDITLREDRVDAADNLGMDNDFGQNDFDGAEFDDFDDMDVERARREVSQFSRASMEPGNATKTSLVSNKAGAAGGTDPDAENNHDLENAGDFMDHDFDNDFGNFGEANDLDQVLYGDNNDFDKQQPEINNGVTDSFQLEPLEVASVTAERAPRTRKRRKLLVDEIKNISGDEMKANMATFHDILQQPDLAPPTKKLMHLREHGVTEKLFSMPGCQALANPDIIRIYQSHLVPHSRTTDETITAGEEIRRDLSLDDIDHDFDHANFDDIDSLNSDRQESIVPVFETIEEVDENVQPDQGDLTNVSEKRTRKSRQEKEKPQPEESGDEEEDEQRYSKRTRGVATAIAAKLKSYESITLNDLLSKRSTRKTAAQNFYALLELAKWQAIEVSQEEPYGEITILEGPEMEAVLAA